MSILFRGLVRALAVVVLYAIVFGDSTRDAVGIGLLFLPIVAFFALVVSAYDGWRSGLRVAATTWVLAAVLVGFGVPVWAVASGVATSFTEQVREYTVILGLLTLLPALLGAGLGALVGALVRRPGSTPRPVDERDGPSAGTGRQAR